MTVKDNRLYSEILSNSTTTTASTADTLLYLTPEEQALYSYLCVQKKRLEQEHISQHFANRYLLSLVS